MDIQSPTELWKKIIMETIIMEKKVRNFSIIDRRRLQMETFFFHNSVGDCIYMLYIYIFIYSLSILYIYILNILYLSYICRYIIVITV